MDHLFPGLARLRKEKVEFEESMRRGKEIGKMKRKERRRAARMRKVDGRERRETGDEGEDGEDTAAGGVSSLLSVERSGAIDPTGLDTASISHGILSGCKRKAEDVVSEELELATKKTRSGLWASTQAKQTGMEHLKVFASDITAAETETDGDVDTGRKRKAGYDIEGEGLAKKAKSEDAELHQAWQSRAKARSETFGPQVWSLDDDEESDGENEEARSEPSVPQNPYIHDSEETKDEKDGEEADQPTIVFYKGRIGTIDLINDFRDITFTDHDTTDLSMSGILFTNADVISLQKSVEPAAETTMLHVHTKSETHVFQFVNDDNAAQEMDAMVQILQAIAEGDGRNIPLTVTDSAPAPTQARPTVKSVPPPSTARSKAEKPKATTTNSPQPQSQSNPPTTPSPSISILSNNPRPPPCPTDNDIITRSLHPSGPKSLHPLLNRDLLSWLKWHDQDRGVSKRKADLIKRCHEVIPLLTGQAGSEAAEKISVQEELFNLSRKNVEEGTTFEKGGKGRW